MNDGNQVEQRLRGLTPRGTEPELRGQVLAAVGRELAADRVSRWRRSPGLAVAASLLLGVVLNVWVNKASDRRLARLYGPPPVPRQIAELAEAVASVTDAQTGQSVRQQLLAAWWSRPIPPSQGICSCPLTLNDLEFAGKEQRDERLQKDPEMDGHHRRDTDRDTSGCQRNLGLEDRFTT